MRENRLYGSVGGRGLIAPRLPYRLEAPRVNQLPIPTSLRGTLPRPVSCKTTP